MNSQEAITTTKNQTEKICHSDYRREVIAEIITYGRAASKSNEIFQVQINDWSDVLAAIPTRKLFICFVAVSRGRVSTYGEESLKAGEMLVAWQKINGYR